ncbi:MAG: hypothetical protein IJE25_06555 [Clostridia bacterium]|nr:hypothetical protein [Clostridia bacterium]
MKQTKKLAISAMLVALSATLMSAGAMLEVADLAACAIASLFVVLAYIELHSPYTWLVWLASSVVTALMFFGSPVWSEYFLFFGLYPIIKAYIERAPRPLWWVLKIAFINAVVWVLILLVDGVLGIPVIEMEGSLIFLVGIYLLVNVAFVVYDLFLTAMIRAYMLKWRKHFARFFK